MCCEYSDFLILQIVESDNEKLAKYSVGIGAARFQLQYMGPYLFRDERTDPDLRIQHFIPDTWQVTICEKNVKISPCFLQVATDTILT